MKIILDLPKTVEFLQEQSCVRVTGMGRVSTISGEGMWYFYGKYVGEYSHCDRSSFHPSTIDLVVKGNE